MFSVSAQAFAADSSWKLAGTWEFTSNIPEQPFTYLGAQYTYSSQESGTVVLNMTEIDGQEWTKSYIYFGHGTNHYDGDSNEYVVGPAEQVASPSAVYIPGTPVEVNTTISIRGVAVNETISFTQTDENTLSGTVTLELGGQQITGTFSATRTAEVAENWTIGGDWKYTSNIPAKSVIIDNATVEYSSQESGTLRLNMLTEAAKEIFSSYVYSGSGTSVVKNSSGTDSRGYTVCVSNDLDWGEYKPGRTYQIDAGYINIRGYSVRELLQLVQVGENKIEGKVTLVLQDQAISGTISATRSSDPDPDPDPTPSGNSGGGGGCNAGFGALALLFALPLFRRKK